MSITQKIIISFLLVVVLLVVSLVSVFIFHVTSLQEYKKISNTLIVENTLTDDVADLLEAYTAVSVAPLSSERMSAFLEQKENIFDTFQELDRVIVSSDSRVAYLGLKNIILGIIDDLEKGREAIVKGEIVEATEFYNQGLYKKTFVETNVTLLVLHELTYLREIEQEIKRKYAEQLFIIGGWVTLLVLVTVLYAFIFARSITIPIRMLSHASKKVSDGDYAFKTPELVLIRQDELGILARSFNSMLQKLNLKITQVEAATATVQETKSHLEERNRELERFNSMVINREIKMVELKRRISELEREVKNKESK
jgi:methyl-accepting chemotaxis protein